MIRSCFVGVTLVAMLSAACADNQGRGDAADRAGSAAGEGGGASGAANPTSPASPGTGTGSAANAELRLTDADQTFVQKAAHANQMEVDMAKMGQDKAQHDQVKEFADQLEQDHSRALDDLRTIASRASLPLRDEDDAQRTSMTEKMNNANARQFDSQFVSEMIDAHRKDIADFERQQNTATGELKAFIDKTLPVMREHLQKAEALQKQVANTSNRSNQ